MLNKLARKFFYDNKNINNSVVLIGTGRSGTTWVEDIINCNNDFRIMFEPFNTHYVPLLKNWKHRQYISSKSKNSKYYEDTRKILRPPWSFQPRGYGVHAFNMELTFVACFLQIRCILFRACGRS